MKNNDKHITRNVVFSLIFLLIAIGLLLFYVLKAQRLIESGIDEKIFYILLIPLGFSSAAFLFGALKSYAHYSGKHLQGTLEMGGPIIVFILTILGGIKLVPKNSPFDYLFLVMDKNGNARNTINCSLQLQLGTEIKETKIEQGKARFYGIPFNYKSNQAVIYIVSNDWKFINGSPKQKVFLKNQAQEIIIIKDTTLNKAIGYIYETISNPKQEVGFKPIEGVTVSLASLNTKTDSTGYFEINLTDDASTEPYDINLFKKGYQPQHILITPSNRQQSRIVMTKD